MSQIPFDQEEKREKFERSYQYLLTHPDSCSVWEEIRYKYYHKGYFQEEIKNLIHSEDPIIVRGAAATLSEFGSDPLWYEELKEIYETTDDKDVKTSLLHGGLRKYIQSHSSSENV